MLKRTGPLPYVLAFLLVHGAMVAQGQTLNKQSDDVAKKGATRYKKCFDGPPSAPGRTCTVTQRRPMLPPVQPAQVVQRLPSPLPARAPEPGLPSGKSATEKVDAVVPPKTAVAVEAQSKPAAAEPAEQPETSARKETVPGELTEQVSEDVHPRQEHILKSLPAKGGWTVIPLPAFSYAHNESYWAGALVPILKANDKDELEDIFAPLYLHNQFINETFSLNYFGYRSETIQYRAIVAYATKVERHLELSFKDTGAGGGRYILAAEGNWFKNAFARFFGVGNSTADDKETTYTSREANIRLSAGINLNEDFSLLWTERYRDVRVENGIIPTLPQTKLRFTGIEGIAGAEILAHRLAALYDTRDNLLTPLKGTYVSLYGEIGHNLIHDEADRWFRLSLDARHLMPHASGRMVFVARFLMDKLFSQGVPFYERPMLGGENTLRGFGLNRFTNDNLFLINLEERIRILSKRVFDNPIELEAAPFLDVGRVNRDFAARIKNTQVNPGMGIRVISRPNVVGRLDIANGKDGGTVFVGLDYPF
ncbi:MAG: hypothetical protein D4R81_03695 [Nitrospiraceae bacterium]|nr:MAG: hypothetical protein D4R81_03695 [Nitrospiraceae bacterium]